VDAMHRCEAGCVPDFGMKRELAARRARRGRCVVQLAAGLVALLAVLSMNSIAAASMQPLARSQASCPYVLMMWKLRNCSPGSNSLVVSAGSSFVRRSAVTNDASAYLKEGRSRLRSTRTFPHVPNRPNGLLRPRRASAKLDRWPR
jgi:hypothetical protein